MLLNNGTILLWFNTGNLSYNLAQKSPKTPKRLKQSPKCPKKAEAKPKKNQNAQTGPKSKQSQTGPKRAKRGLTGSNMAKLDQKGQKRLNGAKTTKSQLAAQLELSLAMSPR